MSTKDPAMMRASRDEAFQDALRRHTHAIGSPYEVMQAAVAAIDAERPKGQRLAAILAMLKWSARKGTAAELAEIDVSALTHDDIECLAQLMPASVTVPVLGKVT